MCQLIKIVCFALFVGVAVAAVAEKPAVLVSDTPVTGTLGTPADCTNIDTLLQPFDDEFFTSAVNSDMNAGYAVAESYLVGGSPAPFPDGLIQTVRVWGIEAFFDGVGWNSCTDGGDGFTVTGYTDAGSQPGSLQFQESALVATQIDTGLLFAGGWPIYEYTISLPNPPSNQVAWLSVERQDDLADSCWFMWINNTTGLYDNYAMQYQDGVWVVVNDPDPPYDMAICVGWDIPVELQSFGIE
jgi:hypothetical protein